MGLFAELDIASATDNPFAIPDNTYPCVLESVEVKANEKGNHGLYLKFVISEGEHKGKKITEYKRIPHPDDAEVLDEADKKKARYYINQRLSTLGVPDERMNDVEPDDLVGTDCYVSTKQNGDFTNVRNVSVSAPASGLPSAPANPFLK